MHRPRARPERGKRWTGDLFALTEALGTALAARGRFLVVLDNFEQLVDVGTSLVCRWLEVAPEAQFLVTSRQALRVDGELLYELGPLGLPAATRDGEATVVDWDSESMRLFYERAESIEPRFDKQRKLGLAVQRRASRIHRPSTTTNAESHCFVPLVTQEAWLSAGFPPGPIALSSRATPKSGK